MNLFRLLLPLFFTISLRANCSAEEIFHIKQTFRNEKGNRVYYSNVSCKISIPTATNVNRPDSIIVLSFTIEIINAASAKVEGRYQYREEIPSNISSNVPQNLFLAAVMPREIIILNIERILVVKGLTESGRDISVFIVNASSMSVMQTLKIPTSLNVSLGNKEFDLRQCNRTHYEVARTTGKVSNFYNYINFSQNEIVIVTPADVVTVYGIGKHKLEKKIYKSNFMLPSDTDSSFYIISCSYRSANNTLFACVSRGPVTRFVAYNLTLNKIVENIEDVMCIVQNNFEEEMNSILLLRKNFSANGYDLLDLNKKTGQIQNIVQGFFRSNLLPITAILAEGGVFIKAKKIAPGDSWPELTSPALNFDTDSLYWVSLRNRNISALEQIPINSSPFFYYAGLFYFSKRGDVDEIIIRNVEILRSNRAPFGSEGEIVNIAPNIELNGVDSLGLISLDVANYQIEGIILDSIKPVKSVKVNGAEACYSRDSKRFIYQSKNKFEGGESVEISAEDFIGNITKKKITIGNPEKLNPYKFRNVAILIAVQNYPQDKDKLDYPISDVTKLKNLLLNNFNYKDSDIKVLIDPDRIDVTKMFDSLSEVEENIQLLIYYTGHGGFHEKSQEGYWRLKDGQVKSSGTLLDNDQILKYLARINVHHLFLIVDACYGGSIGERLKGDKNQGGDFAKEQFKKTARQALTSGAKEPVPDKSEFFNQLELILKSIKEPLKSATWVHSQLLNHLEKSKGPQPRLNPLPGKSDLGDFYFILKQER